MYASSGSFQYRLCYISWQTAIYSYILAGKQLYISWLTAIYVSWQTVTYSYILPDKQLYIVIYKLANSYI